MWQHESSSEIEAWPGKFLTHHPRLVGWKRCENKNIHENQGQKKNNEQ